MVTKPEIAELIKTELGRDEEELRKLQSRLVSLQERVQANQAWLKAYGFSRNGIGADLKAPDDILAGQLEDQEAAQGSIPEMAVEILREFGPKTMTQLYEALLARGKKIHRASLDAAVRRNAKGLFQMRKRHGKNIIRLQERQSVMN